MRQGIPHCFSARQRRMLLALLVLPVLVLRALVPVGFMPVVVSGGALSIGVCPEQGALPPGIDARALHAGPLAHHHAHHSGGDPSRPSDTRHAPCLFSLSASPAFAAAVAL